MELKKIKEDKDMVFLELKGGTKTFANLLREELWNDKDVSEAADIKEHPYMAQPKLYLKMKEGNKPKKAINDAIKRIEVNIKDLEKEFERALK